VVSDVDEGRGRSNLRYRRHKLSTYVSVILGIIVTVGTLFFGEMLYSQHLRTVMESSVPRPVVEEARSAVAAVGHTTSKEETTFSTHVYKESNGQSMTYYLYMPWNYDPAKKYPLVLLLHGGGERAKPGNSAAKNKALLMNDSYVQVWGPGYPKKPQTSVQNRWPCFVVVPQVVDPQRWVSVPSQNGPYTLPAQPTHNLQNAKNIVDVLQKQYTSIDKSRLYVTGLSLGGYGTWEMAERWPQEFAAAAPLAGAGDPGQAARLVKLPIWAFQGAKDDTVPISSSRTMIAAIRAAGGQPRYTEYASLSHVIWTKVYAPLGGKTVPAFYNWLFAQHK
jgi:predicted peptidase